PLRVECFDISHLQGQDVVASMVAFEDGLARKSEYRRFQIRSFAGQDDARAMQEVISRRFRRYLQEKQRPGEWAGPDEVPDAPEPTEAGSQRAEPVTVPDAPETGEASQTPAGPGAPESPAAPEAATEAETAADQD